MAIKNYGFGDFFEEAEQTEPLVAPQKPKGTYRQVMDKIASYAPSTEGASYWAEQAFEAPRHVLNTATDALMPAVMAPIAGVAGLGSMFAGPEDLSFDQRVNRAADVTNNVLRFGQSNDPKIKEVVGAAHAVLPSMISGTAKFARGAIDAYDARVADIQQEHGWKEPDISGQPEWVKKVADFSDRKRTELDTTARTVVDDTAQYWDEVAASNQPKFKGTFMENPSVTRAAAAFVQGGMSVAIAVPLAATIGPGAAGSILAIGEGGHMYDEAIAAKKTPQEAFKLTATSIALTALLERYGLETILKAAGPAGKRFLRGMVAEVGTENAQNLVQNAVKKHGYDKSVNYIDGIIESTIGGLAGGPAAVVFGSKGETGSTFKPDSETDVKPSPKAEDSIADLLSQLGTALEETQRNKLVEHVTELGSIEATQKAYPNYKTDVNDAYAVALSIMADETGLFKKAQPEDVKSEVLVKPSFDVVGKLFRGEALTDAEVEELQAMPDEDVQREYFRLKSQDDFITDLRERFKLPDADEMQKRSQETFVAELRKRFKLPDEAATHVQKTVEGPVSTEAVPVGPAENVTVVETEPTQIAEPLAEPAEETETLPETDEEIEDELFDDEDEDDVSFDMNRMGSLLADLDEQENPYGNFIAKGNVDTVPNEAEAGDLQAEQDAAKRREELEAQRKVAREQQRERYADEAVDDEATEELTGNLYDEGLHTTEALKEVDSENPAYDTAEQVDTLLKKGAKGVKKLIDDLTGDERGAVGKDISNLKKRLKVSTKHPATYTNSFIPVFADILKTAKSSKVLDMFGGIGKIGRVKQFGYTGTVTANEIEPVLNGGITVDQMQANGVDNPVIGDATQMSFDNDSFDTIVTSPTYGNWMGSMGDSRQGSYKKAAGGTLAENNTGAGLWTVKYEQLHHKAYQEAFRVLEPGGIFVLNMKDFPRSYKLPIGTTVIKDSNNIVKATDWHIDALKKAGFEFVSRQQVEAGTENRKLYGDRLAYEDLVILRKPGIGSRLKSLWSDERGAVGPDISDLKKSLREVSQNVQIAKRKATRISKKAGQELEKVSKQIKAAVDAGRETLPEKLPPLLEDLNKIAQKVQQTIVAEELLKQEKELDKKLLKGLRLKKDTLLKMAGTITRQMEIDIDRPFYDDGDSPIHQFYRLMKEAGRIVPTYRKGTFTVQPHPRPLLDPSKPKLLDPSKDLGGLVKWVGDKLNVETISGQILSPSVVLRPHFAPGQHPIVDALECAICAGDGRRNDFRWKKDVFGDVKSAKKDIEKTLGPLYEKIQIRLEETGRMKRRFVRKLDELKAAKRAVRLNTSRLQSVESTHPRISDFVSDLAKAQEDIEIFTAQKNKLKKQIRAYAKDSKKMLFEGYDAVITELAERNASVRIALDAADSLPSNVNMSETERWRAKQLRKYFEQTRQDLRLRGFPVIESRAYMSHSFGSLMTDDWAKAFKYEPYVPKRFKFLYQSPKSRIWIPDVHMILDNYIPMVNRKLGMQPFLDRWSDFIDHEAPPNMRAMLQKWLRLNMYNDYGGFWNKVTNGFVGLEYLRLIGFSVATATKHAAKYIDTFATNTAGVSMHGTFLAGKSMFQGIADKLGMEGEHPEYEVFKMFVSANQIIRVLDEGPQMQAGWKLVKGLAGSMTMFTEMVDNGTTVMASLLQASGAKMDMLQAKNLVWDAICRANFRGGMDQPLYMKTLGGRIIGMFQTTVQKLTELRVGLLKDFVKGGTDAYGKSNRMKFVRYVMLFGALTMFARRHDKDIAHWFIELPYIRHWFQQSNQTASGIRFMEPKLTGPPPFELVNQMATKGVYHGIKDHVDYTPLWKYITIWNKSYPNSYYTDPVSQMFGLHSLDAGHSKGGSARRSRRRPRRSRRR